MKLKAASMLNRHSKYNICNMDWSKCQNRRIRALEECEQSPELFSWTGVEAHMLKLQGGLLRATSHTGEEPWPWNCESPKEIIQRPSQDHLHYHVVWSWIPKCSVKPYMWPGPRPNAISMIFYSCRSSHMVKYDKSTVVSVRSAMVSLFFVRPTSKRWFLTSDQVTIKCDPFAAM